MSDPRIRLAYFSNASARGGAEEHILTLLRGLDRSRFDACLICSPAVADMLGRDVPSDVKVFALTFDKPWQISGAVKLAKLLRRNRIQILHSHLFYSSLFASPVGWLCGIPAILETPHLRELWREGKGWPKSSFVIDRGIGKCVDGYIAVSKANGMYLERVKRLSAEKIHVIQNGSDLDRFRPDHSAPEDMRSRFGFNEIDRILLIPARLEPQKGHRILFEALAKILEEFPAVRIVCAGEGALLPELQEQVQKLGVANRVSFVGRQQKLEDWFALCEFTVLPSFFEGLPLVAVESLAAGRPMVATAVDGTPEVIVDGKTGLTVPAGDSSALAAAICRLLGDADLCRKMARTGRQWAIENFTQKMQLDRTQELYVDLLRAAGETDYPAYRAQRETLSEPKESIAAEHAR
ncbi:MAG TPA: glycosyltransferase family 4 protein [Candidatus Acidoferrum sp.]|jgi:glycosyltransferase involved in cell wall biosynthesis|nr:glycosyltransferase family 4 protein [Candidatus Acidoferrum sp.]